MGEAAGLAVFLRGLCEIQVGKGVCIRGAWTDPVVLQKFLANQVWRIAAHARDAKVDTGLAKIDGCELGMAVRVVHQ